MSLFGWPVLPVLLAPLIGLAQQPVPEAAEKLLQDPAPVASL
jgi:hypothetical protein